MRQKNFSPDEHGGTSIEFAFVLPIVIGILLGTLEVGLAGLASNMLDNSVQRAARTIRVGATGGATTASEFEDQICAGMFGARADCRANLSVSVRKFTTFDDAQRAAASSPAGEFDKGAPGDIILVKATYAWPFFMPFFNLGFKQSGPATLLLDARTAFKNEPYL